MKKKLLLCCMAFSVLAACKKNDNKPDNLVKYLTRMLKDTEGVATNIALAYDDKNRLVDYTETEDGVLITSRTLTYDANGRLLKLENDAPEEETYEVYTFTYHAAGIPQKYERKISDNDGLQTTEEGIYTITGGKVTKIIEKNMDPAIPGTRTIDLTYNGNNVSKVTVTNQDNSVSSIELTHGSKKNPMHYALPLDYALLADLALEVLSENEIVGLKLTLGPNIVLERNTTYQYDSHGYPTYSEDKDEDSNEVSKTTYQYK